MNEPKAKKMKLHQKLHILPGLGSKSEKVAACSVLN